MTQALETSVLIVGGGPVGHALAHDLGQRGIDCILIEQNGPKTDHPKASAINARSMEFMRRWGLADGIKKTAAPEGFPHTALYCTGLNGFEIARIERPGHGGKAPSKDSPERAQRCNQLWLDPLLRDAAASHACVKIFYHCRFDTLEERSTDVLARATLLERNEQLSIAAAYVVDCSGGHSPIKRAFGIDWEGAEQIGYHVSIFMRAPELWKYHDKGPAALITFVDERGAWRNLVLLDGRELYRLGIRDKAAYDDPDGIDREAIFRKAVGRDDVPHEFISTARWVARNVVSTGYRRGRVFMAGDAAHLNHPASGIGLNTGLGDIWDLGWKLEAVIKGWGGSGLLDAYEPERRAVALRNVGNAQASHANDRALKPHPEIALDTAAGTTARRDMGDTILSKQTKKFITDGIALGYRYANSAIVCADGTPEPINDISVYHPTSWPGARAPHAWVSEGQSTLDLFGHGFHLLGFGKADGSALESALTARGAPVSSTQIDDPQIAELYERKLVLVRPDGHVAWRGDALPDNPAAVADTVRGA